MDLKNKLSGKILVVIVGIIIFILIGTGAYIWQNKKTDVLADKNTVKMTYDGYQGEGVASFNLSDIQIAVINAQVDKTKLPKTIRAQIFFDAKDGQQIVENINNAIDTAVPKNKQILSTLKMWYKETSIKLDKDTRLRNGDKITLNITTNEDDTNPVKESTQSFEVHGLKPIKEIPTSKLLDRLNVKFYGINGYGRTTITSEMDTSSYLGIDWRDTINVKNNTKLSNGDVAKITVPDGWFKTSKGTRYVGSHTVEKKVSGLIDLKSGNIKQLKRLMDKAITNEYPYDEDDPSSIAPQFEGFFALPHTDTGRVYDAKDVFVNNESDKNVEFQFIAVYLLPDEHGSLTGRPATVSLFQPTFTGNDVDLPSVYDLDVNSDIENNTVNGLISDYKEQGILVINKSN